jgi:hypothetical protein
MHFKKKWDTIQRAADKHVCASKAMRLYLSAGQGVHLSSGPEVPGLQLQINQRIRQDHHSQSAVSDQTRAFLAHFEHHMHGLHEGLKELKTSGVPTASVIEATQIITPGYLKYWRQTGLLQLAK